MTKDLLQSLVEEDYGYEHNSGIWGRSVKHNSLVVNEESQFWFWNSTGQRGDVRDYLLLVRGYTPQEADAFLGERRFYINPEVKKEGVTTPPYEKLVELLWENGKDDRDYWYRRCLDNSTIDKYRLGFFEGWFLVPLYDDGRFVNFECRQDIPTKKIGRWYKHTKPVLYNSEILDFVDTVYISEGTIGAVLLNQMGFPAISQMGSNIWREEWYPLFNKIKEVFYVEDNDPAGRIASANISKALGTDRVRIISFDGREEKYDAVDFFRDGGTVEEFKQLARDSKYIYERQNLNDTRRSGGGNFRKATFQNQRW